MSIRLSEKHGVNPSLMQCFYCGEEKGIALLGKLKDDQEAPRSAVFDKTPCDECKKLMEQGIFFIEVRDGEQGSKNPYRTGRQWVIKDDCDLIHKGITDDELRSNILKDRVLFLEESTSKMIGLNKD